MPVFWVKGNNVMTRRRNVVYIISLDDITELNKV